MQLFITVCIGFWCYVPQIWSFCKIDAQFWLGLHIPELNPLPQRANQCLITTLHTITSLSDYLHSIVCPLWGQKCCSQGWECRAANKEALLREWQSHYHVLKQIEIQLIVFESFKTLCQTLWILTMQVISQNQKKESCNSLSQNLKSTEQPFTKLT